MNARTTPREIAVKRIYDPADDDDGFRVLVDRVWPRGVSKERAAVDLWARELAPSTDLRKWFGHEPARWPGFRERYRRELQEREADLRALVAQCGARRLTLLFSARDVERNQAVVLAEWLEAFRD